MATLALGAIGSAFGPVGGFIGATVGGLIDNLLLFPLLFPPPDQKGPRIDGISVTSANEGTPMNWFLGPRVRNGGFVIWMSDLEEVEKEVEVGKGSGGSSTSYEYFVSIAIAFGDADPQGVAAIRQIMADAKVIYNDGPTTFYDDITLYDGSQTDPDPFLEAELGDGNVPIFKNQVYGVVQRLFLGEYGNRTPNFQGIHEQANDVSVGQAIGWIMERGGYEEEDYDVSRVSYCLRGVNYSGVLSTKDELESLVGTYSIGVQELDGQIQFFDRGREVAVRIDPDHLCTGDAGGGMEFDDRFERNQPDEVSITFVNDELDLQPGSTRYRDHSRNTSPENQIRFDAPVTMTSEEANQTARRQYWQAAVERRTVRFALPPGYAHLAAGDLAVIDRNGEDVYLRLVQVERGANGRMELIGVVTWPGIFDQDGFGDSSGYAGLGEYIPPELDPWYADMAAVNVQGVDDVYVYWGACPIEPEDQFRGASLYASMTGENFVARSTVSKRAITGRTTSGPGPGTVHLFDDFNEVHVKLDEPDRFTPTSATDSEVMNGERNICALRTPDGEWEIFGFVDVTPLDEGEYKLTRLLRGLRGTEHLVGEHAVGGARLVFLNAGSSTVAAWRAGEVHLGSPQVKAVPYLALLSTVDPQTIVVRGRSMRPFAPDLLRAVRRTLGVGNEDVEITWARRSKKLVDAFRGNAGPLANDETPETYNVTIRLGGYLAPILYETTVFEPEFNFTQALRDEVASTQPTWTEGRGFRVFVTQVSAIVGESPAAELLVPRR